MPDCTNSPYYKTDDSVLHYIYYHISNFSWTEDDHWIGMVIDLGMGNLKCICQDAKVY